MCITRFSTETNLGTICWQGTNLTVFALLTWFCILVLPVFSFFGCHEFYVYYYLFIYFASVHVATWGRIVPVKHWQCSRYSLKSDITTKICTWVTSRKCYIYQSQTFELILISWRPKTYISLFLGSLNFTC